MKELILTLAVTMLATHTPAQQVIPPPLTLTISDFGNSQIRVITQNVPPRVPYTYIATSTDLINWTPAITNINLNGAATNVFSATNTVSFYRVVNPF